MRACRQYLYRALVGLILGSGSVFLAPLVADLSTTQWPSPEKIDLPGNQPPDGLVILPGPNPETPGFQVLPGGSNLRLPLSRPISGQGTLSFWIRLDQTYRSGLDTVEHEQQIIALPGAFSLDFSSEKEMIRLTPRFHGTGSQSRRIPVQIPEFPGESWHHLSFTWKGEEGLVNAWFDGTPFFLPTERVAEWPAGNTGTLVIFPSQMALAGIEVYPEALSPEHLSSLPGDNRGSLDAWLGAGAFRAFCPQNYREILIYDNPFAQAEDTSNWVLEGIAGVSFAEGWMTLTSDPEDNFVYWCPEVFPENFLAEWEMEILEPHGLCIVFFAAHGPEGMDIFDPALPPRDGTFSYYTRGDINSYHISYFANNPGIPRSMANLRKNSGFYLLANGPVGIDPSQAIGPGKTQRVTLLKEGPRLRMAVNGTTFIDFTDDGVRAGPVWGEGHIGLRQMRGTLARYRNFRVYGFEGNTGRTD